ncbi:hypothetical protein BD560DRAFT_427705 [Blakeslea trispora]|nr:hypothetical protein BD560DRAFT_427705 [Blakeslea trispora]
MNFPHPDFVDTTTNTGDDDVLMTHQTTDPTELPVLIPVPPVVTELSDDVINPDSPDNTAPLDLPEEIAISDEEMPIQDYEILSDTADHIDLTDETHDEALDERLSLPDPVDSHMATPQPQLSEVDVSTERPSLPELISEKLSPPVNPLLDTSASEISSNSNELQLTPSPPSGPFSFTAPISPPKPVTPTIISDRKTDKQWRFNVNVPTTSPTVPDLPSVVHDARGRPSVSEGGDVGLVITAGSDIEEELSRFKPKSNRKRFAPIPTKRNTNSRDRLIKKQRLFNLLHVVTNK